MFDDDDESKVLVRVRVVGYAFCAGTCSAGVYSVDSCLSNVAGVGKCRQRNVVMRDK
jgi:hypothetical protein